MADKSAIEWTDATWNPVTGCDRVSPGCAHCYALDLAARLKGMGNARYQNDGDPKTSGPGFGVTLHEDVLDKPLKWRRPRMVFVNSMSDLFHDAVPDDFIAAVFGVMARAERHVFQVLTKRPERMQRLLGSPAWQNKVLISAAGEGNYTMLFPLPNVWLGVSIENRRFVYRADLLRETPAAVRFISAEPLLGPLVPDGPDSAAIPCSRCGWTGRASRWGDEILCHDCQRPLDLTDICWLIVGGESGIGHRRIEPTWVRDLRDTALYQRSLQPTPTAFFFKQWGGRTPKAGGRELDSRTWDEFPVHLATSQRAA
jgi:protein gp37